MDGGAQASAPKSPYGTVGGTSRTAPGLLGERTVSESKGQVMDNQQLLWWVIGVVVAIIIIVVVIVWAKRSRDRRQEAAHRAAEDLRGEADRQQGRTLAEEERAAAVRHDAEAAEEQARQLRVEAEEREWTADSSRGALDARLREADRLDPEVRTDRDGRRVDGADPVNDAGPAGDAGPGSDAGPGRHAADTAGDDARGPRS